MTAHLTARGLSLETPSGRPLIRSLSMQLTFGDRVAVVGRNGVGKSTLLRVLAGAADAAHGFVHSAGSRRLVGQHAPDVGASPGQAQRKRLEAAFDARPDLLLLDEPTRDLDIDAINWLCGRLERWRGGLLIVSHARRLLQQFEDFFVVAESGCRHFHGSFDALLYDLDAREEAREERYVRTLNDLVAREEAHERTRRRRERKGNLGRIRELRRGTPRSTLNGKRSLAQESLARRSAIQENRLGRARAWAKATRRAMTVELPLEVALPTPPKVDTPLVRLEDVSVEGVFEHLSLVVREERIGVVGPNGSGKSTLLDVMAGDRRPTSGRARREVGHIAYVSQNSLNWCRDDSLLEALEQPLEDAVDTLRAHRFPFALAGRPLRELSPGERLRAALICAFQDAPGLVILDEPTDHLDFTGVIALERVLRAWSGGLVVVSHDVEFLQAIDVREWIDFAQPVLPSKKPTELPSGSRT